MANKKSAGKQAPGAAAGKKSSTKRSRKARESGHVGKGSSKVRSAPVARGCSVVRPPSALLPRAWCHLLATDTPAQRTAKYHASGGLEREISSRRKHADLKKKIDQREHRKRVKTGGKRERPAWEAADEEAEVMGQAAIARSKCVG